MYTKPAVLALLLAGTNAELTKLEQIVGGILKGALEAEGFTDIIQCFKDGENLFKDSETAVADFE